MKKRGLILTLAIGISLAVTCQSMFAGHFEGSDNTELTKYLGQQVVPAEYQPVSSVVVNYQLFDYYQKENLVKGILDSNAKSVYVVAEKQGNMDINNKVFNKLRNVLGSDISKVKIMPTLKKGETTVWARDWAPLGAIANSTGDIRLIDFNYYNERPTDDSAPTALSKALNLERVSVPVYNEGGNFMVTASGNGYTTTSVVESNAQKNISADMVLSKEDIIKYYKDYTGCKNFHVFERMPYEGTGHIDMWSKLLNDNTVIVGKIFDYSVENYKKNNSPSNKSINKVVKIQNFLEDRAVEFKNMGYNVIRIPSLLPVTVNDEDIFSTYTNSLLVNGTALVPRYKSVTDGKKDYGKYYDNEFLPKYEEMVQAAYQSQGYKVVWIDADNLSFDGGTVHCSTMQLP